MSSGSTRSTRARSHWVVKAPAGKTVEWESVVTDDEPGRLIAWQSVEGADIASSGRVEFLDAAPGRGTMVRATFAYDPPAGGLGEWIAKIFQREPNVQARRDLRRLKQFLETGEVTSSAGPSGPRRPNPPTEHKPCSRRRESNMRAITWQGRHKVQVDTVPDPEIVNPARRDHPGHLDRDLRLGPPPLRRLYPDHAQGRHPRPRIHGRGGRDRAEEHAAARASASSSRSPSRAATASSAARSNIRPATTAIRRPPPTCRRRSTAIRWAAPSATRI